MGWPGETRGHAKALGVGAVNVVVDWYAHRHHKCHCLRSFVKHRESASDPLGAYNHPTPEEIVADSLLINSKSSRLAPVLARRADGKTTSRVLAPYALPS